MIKIEELNLKNLNKFYKYANTFKGLEKKQLEFYPLLKPFPSSLSNLFSRFKKWKKKEYIFLVCFINLNIVGHAMVKNLRKNYSKTTNKKLKFPSTGIYVQKKYRKHKIGSLMMNLIIMICKFRKIKKIYATVSETNIASKKLHRKVGYKKTNVFFKRRYKLNKNKFYNFKDFQYINEL